VQIGSNDGEQLDPLRREILSRTWTGLMVEPVPYVFRRLVANYGHLSRITLANVAIADHDGTATLFHLPESDDPELWEWYHALASFRRDVVAAHEHLIPDIAKRIEPLDVPCLTFDSLCRSYGLANVDLVQIDTEGFDFEIIKEIDLDVYRPLVLMFEHLHFDEPTRRACRDHLRAHGYEDLSNGMDTLCLRTSTMADDDAVRVLFAQQQQGSPWHLVDSE
jgi:FkbM family methyltransferase